MLARLAEHPHGRGSGADQVAHRLVRRIRHPHRRELAGPVQLRQAQRITPVGLHPVARLARDQGRRHHHAGMAEALELPLQAVAAGAGLVAEAQLPPIPGQPSRQLGDDLGPVREDPELPDLATPARPPRPPRRSSPCGRPCRQTRCCPSGPLPMQEARRRPTRRNPRWVHAAERAARLSPQTSGLTPSSGCLQWPS